MKNSRVIRALAAMLASAGLVAGAAAGIAGVSSVTPKKDTGWNVTTSASRDTGW